MARFQNYKENVPPSSISFQLSNDYDDEQDENEDLKARIEEYKKQNPEQLDELTRFVDDVIKDAQLKVAEKQMVEEGKARNGNSFMTGLKSRRVVTRARSLAVRFFDVISNCANSVPNPVQAVRLRRQQTTSAPSPRHTSFRD